MECRTGFKINIGLLQNSIAFSLEIKTKGRRKERQRKGNKG